MKLLVMPLALASMLGGCERAPPDRTSDPSEEVPVEASCEVDPCQENLQETASGYWSVGSPGVEECAICRSGTCRRELCPRESQCPPETFVCVPEQEQDDASFGDCDAVALLPPPDAGGPYARTTSDLFAGPLYLLDIQQNMPCPEGLFSWSIAGAWDPNRRPTGFEVELDGVVYPMGAMTRGEFFPEGDPMETIAFGFCLPISPATAGPIAEDDRVELDVQVWVQPIAGDKRGLRRCRSLFVAFR